LREDDFVLGCNGWSDILFSCLVGEKYIKV